MEHALAMTRSEEVELEDLPVAIREYRCRRVVVDGSDKSRFLTLSEFTQRYIEQVLDAFNGNKSQACRALGMDRRTLYRKLERFQPE